MIYYGIDAPPVIRNLLLGSLACFLIIYGSSHFIPAPWPNWLVTIINIAWVSAIAYIITALLMLLSSLVGKQLQADKLLNRLSWRGDEQVLDAGCGRGLLLIKAAQRLPHGRAYGVDIWRLEDLSSNAAQKVIVNAIKARVTDRIELHDNDIRQLPFEHNTFDYIVSSMVIHNITGADQRKKALTELVRVLKPGGTILIQDFQFTQEYADYLQEIGLKNVQKSGFQWLIFPPARIVSAQK